MARGLFFIGLLLGSGPCAASAADLRLTMEDVVARAVTSSADLRADQKDIDVANAAVLRSQVLLPSNPYLSGGAQSFFENNTVPGQPSTSFTLGYGASLSQEFEVAGQRGRRIAVAKAGLSRAKWDAKNAELAIIASAKTTFVRALAAADRLALARKNVEATEALLPKGGERSGDESDRMQRNILRMHTSRTRQQLRAAEFASRDALTALRYTLDLAPDTNLEIVGSLETTPRPVPSSSDLVALAKSQRADLAAMRTRAVAAAKQVDLSDREAIPNVTLSGSVTRYSNDTFAGGELSFYLPVFDRHDGETAEAIAERERVVLLVHDLERAIEWQVQQAYSTYQAALDSLRTMQREILPLSEENLSAERHLFEEGRVDAGDLLGIQIDAMSARGEYIDDLLACNEAFIELERTVGGAIEGAPGSVSPGS